MKHFPFHNRLVGATSVRPTRALLYRMFLWRNAVEQTGFKYLLLVAVGVTLVLPAYAEEQLDFFPKDMAATVFDSDVKMLMPQMKEDKPILSTKQQKDTEPAQAEIGTADSAETAQAEDDTASLRDKLARKYGDPKEDPKIRVQADAPPSMKGMLEALDAGDQDLAYDYAQQYVKSVQRYQKLYGDVVSMTGAVMKSSNQAEGTQWQNVPTLFEHQELANSKREEQVKSLLQMASQAQATPSAPETTEISQSRNRMAIKAALHSRTDLPAPGPGSINLIAFVDPERPMLCGTLQEMVPLARAYSTDSKVSLLAATLGQHTEEDIKAVSQRLGLPFPMHDGADLARKLGVTSKCTLAVISPEQKKAVLLSSPATAEFMDELITSMKGASRI